MSSFVHYCLFDSRETVEDDGTRTAFHIVDRGLSKGEGGGGGDGVPIDTLESVGRHSRE